MKNQEKKNDGGNGDLRKRKRFQKILSVNTHGPRWGEKKKTNQKNLGKKRRRGKNQVTLPLEDVVQSQKRLVRDEKDERHQKAGGTFHRPRHLKCNQRVSPKTEGSKKERKMGETQSEGGYSRFEEETGGGEKSSFQKKRG